jgi:hypothetical protein
MEPLPETPVEMTQEQKEAFVKAIAEKVTTAAHATSEPQNSKTSIDLSASSVIEPTEEDGETPSSRKEFEDFKRKICGTRPLWSFTFGEIDTVLMKSPMDLAIKLKKAHLRAIQQRKKNSKIQEKVDAVHEGRKHEFVNRDLEGREIEWSEQLYEHVIRNDTSQKILLMGALIAVLAFFAPFGVIYLGTKLAKGLKNTFPDKFGWIPL